MAAPASNPVTPSTSSPTRPNDLRFLGGGRRIKLPTRDTPVTFTVAGIDLQNDPLTFVVKDPTSFATNGGTASDPANVDVSIQVTGASGSTPAIATVTLTPLATFSGTVNMTHRSPRPVLSTTSSPSTEQNLQSWTRNNKSR